jgi:hypothetical protein
MTFVKKMEVLCIQYIINAPSDTNETIIKEQLFVHQAIHFQQVQAI